MNYYQRFIGDYVRDTIGLTMEEDGCYCRLLDWMYANEEPVPHDIRHSIARAMTPGEKKTTDKVLGKFFKRIGAGWEHSRVLDEIEKANTRRANGKKGGRPKTKTQS